ncbi:MAG: hypothetical protein ABJE95_17175 [Byssovorax sp.]
MEPARLLAILGMSDAGKTTYLGRLWLGVHAQIGRLHAAGLPEVLRPLRDVSSYLLQGNYPPRTRRGEVTAFNVPLRWAGAKEALPFTLAFTDYSGEELERIFTQRDAGWTTAWQMRATGSLGLLLFLRPRDILKPTSARLIGPMEAAQWAHVRGEEPVPEPKKPRAAEDPAFLFDAAFAPQSSEELHRRPNPDQAVRPPTAVALVEVLQFLRQERRLLMGEAPDSNHFRVAVVVTCWDAIPRGVQDLGPEPFVKAHFPLLHDFLCSNFNSDGVRVFGLSSTGGDLADPVFLGQYEQIDPELMGNVVYHPTPGGDPISDPDIALPIGWLLEGDDALPGPRTSSP